LIGLFVPVKNDLGIKFNINDSLSGSYNLFQYHKEIAIVYNNNILNLPYINQCYYLASTAVAGFSFQMISIVMAVLAILIKQYKNNR
ncbi:MAG: hypothetical protein HRS50_01570, partial [Mycoplasmataceae bacterium]|nr:hypothetical protein [Mycoplasmataceae bacterium]